VYRCDRSYPTIRHAMINYFFNHLCCYVIISILKKDIFFICSINSKVPKDQFHIRALVHKQFHSNMCTKDISHRYFPIDDTHQCKHMHHHSRTCMGHHMLASTSTHSPPHQSTPRSCRFYTRPGSRKSPACIDNQSHPNTDPHCSSSPAHTYPTHNSTQTPPHSQIPPTHTSHHSIDAAQDMEHKLRPKSGMCPPHKHNLHH
jgi:hypothetical protein